MLVENRQFEPTLPLFGAHLGVTPLKFRRDLMRQKTSPWPIARRCLRDPIRLAVPACDGQTDTRRQHVGAYCASIASRGKTCTRMEHSYYGTLIVTRMRAI